MRRLTLLVAALVIVLIGAGVPAYADDAPTAPPKPTGTPRSVPGDPFGGQTLPPGPVYVITPGSTGTKLPATSDPDVVKQQVKKDVAKARTASPGATPSSGASATPSAPAVGSSADPASQAPSTAVAHRVSSSSHAWVWWVVAVIALGAAAVVVLRLRRRRTTGDDAGVA